MNTESSSSAAKADNVTWNAGNCKGGHIFKLWHVYENGKRICTVSPMVKSEIETAHLIAAAPEMLTALQAVQARINGEWDHPALLNFGPLSTDTQADCLRMLQSTIWKAQKGVTL